MGQLCSFTIKTVFVCDYHKLFPQVQIPSGCYCIHVIQFEGGRCDPCEGCDPKDNPQCDKCVGS